MNQNFHYLLFLIQGIKFFIFFMAKRQKEGNENPPSKKQKLNTDDSKYIIYNGRRWVEPYYFNFVAHAKKRWLNKGLLEIYTKEFSAYTIEYYVRFIFIKLKKEIKIFLKKQAIKEGKITVNDKIVDENYLIKNGDLIVHRAHIHEPSVLSTSIEVNFIFLNHFE